jgi:hypothetical protein
MTLRCLWVASNVTAERVLGGLENNTKSALNVKQVIVASGKVAVLLPNSVFPGDVRQAAQPEGSDPEPW